MLQVLVPLTVLVGSIAYFGSHQNVHAQSTAATQAIVSAAGCSLGSGDRCNKTVDWPSSFANTSYAALCTTTFYYDGTWENQVSSQIESQTVSSVTMNIYNNAYPGTVTTSINCIGVHN
jgi:hypothetical protein